MEVLFRGPACVGCRNRLSRQLLQRPMRLMFSISPSLNCRILEDRRTHRPPISQDRLRRARWCMYRSPRDERICCGLGTCWHLSHGYDSDKCSRFKSPCHRDVHVTGRCVCKFRRLSTPRQLELKFKVDRLGAVALRNRMQTQHLRFASLNGKA
jgi:hypothetical protein